MRRQDRVDRARRLRVFEPRGAFGQHQQRGNRSHVVGGFPHAALNDPIVHLAGPLDLAGRDEEQRNRYFKREVGNLGAEPIERFQQAIVRALFSRTDAGSTRPALGRHCATQRA